VTVALMWEAKAAPGRGAELLEWARANGPEPEPQRREFYTAPGGRVLAISWWDAADLSAELPELPDPPGELTARPVHRWRFQQV
jgi:hypothetical protein